MSDEQLYRQAEHARQSALAALETCGQQWRRSGDDSRYYNVMLQLHSASKALAQVLDVCGDEIGTQPIDPIEDTTRVGRPGPDGS